MRLRPKKATTSASHGFMTYAEIAEVMSCSKETVRNIEAAALRKLSSPRVAKQLREIAETIGLIETSHHHQIF